MRAQDLAIGIVDEVIDLAQTKRHVAEVLESARRARASREHSAVTPLA